MFQVIYIFSDWILIKQIMISPTTFSYWGKQIFDNFLGRGLITYLGEGKVAWEVGGNYAD